MKYETRDYLRENTSRADEPRECPTFLLGEKLIAKWTELYTNDVWYEVILVPAYSAHLSGRCFMLTKSKMVYSQGCAGPDDKLIPFEEGIKLLCAHGIYPWVQE